MRAELKPLTGIMYNVAHVVSIQRSSGKTFMPAFSWMLSCHHSVFLWIQLSMSADDPAKTAVEGLKLLRPDTTVKKCS